MQQECARCNSPRVGTHPAAKDTPSCSVLLQSTFGFGTTYLYSAWTTFSNAPNFIMVSAHGGQSSQPAAIHLGVQPTAASHCHCSERAVRACERVGRPAGEVTHKEFAGPTAASDP